MLDGVFTNDGGAVRFHPARRLTREGEIWLALRHRWADGTTQIRFDPLEVLERLAVLTPRPRVNLIL